MYLEEILPDIRKGRRFRRKGWLVTKSRPDWWISEKAMNRAGAWEAQFEDLMADDWELEPEVIIVPMGTNYELHVHPGGGISIMLGGSQVIALGAEDIDTLRVNSLAVRREKPPGYVAPTNEEATNLWLNASENVCEMVKQVHRAGYEQGVLAKPQ